MKKILVTGGAGYIGSHTVKKLEKTGYEVVIYDNFSSGHHDAVRGFAVVEGDLADFDLLDKTFKENKFDGVIHFAGSIEAGESMTDPRRFYKNNVVNALNLANVMVDNNVKNIVFSSSAAVYGEPEKVPIEETDAKVPTNVYGLTKLMFEQILDSYDYAYGLKSVALRYFNAAGADPSGENGADHKHKTHLITLIMLTALGKRDAIKVFGTDYDTPDGTGIRDYVHVEDLADAHVLALEHLFNGGESDKFNLGNEKGNSVKEVIDVSRKVSGREIQSVDEARRDGDPAKLVASSAKAKNVLHWNPKFDTIEQITETAWNWHLKNPDGFKE